MTSNDEKIIQDLGKEAIILAVPSAGKLFSLNHSNYIDDLKNENLSDELKKRFKKEGHELGKKTRLRYMRPSNVLWDVIVDDKNKYFIHEKRDEETGKKTIKVYDREIESKKALGKAAKEILDDSKEIFGDFKDNLEYDDYKVATLRQDKIDELEDEGILKQKKKSKSKEEGKPGDRQPMILDNSYEIKLKHRKWLVAPGEKEKKKFFFDVKEKAEEAHYHLGKSHDDSYESFRNELINFIEFKDLYSVAYLCKPLIEYLEECFIKFKSSEDPDIRLAKPEFKLYLKIWKKALEKKYDELLEDSNHTDILLDALDLLYDEFTYSAEILEEEMTEEIEMIESITKLAEEMRLYEDENKEEFEQLLDKIENHGD